MGHALPQGLRGPRTFTRRLDGALGRQDGNAALARFRERGLILLERAFRGYVRERGGAGGKLLQGVS